MTRHIGIEISATAVRMAEIHLGERPKLVAYAEQDLPRGAIGDGAVLQRDVVRSAIAHCLTEGHFRRRRFGGRIGARVGIAGLRAITREFEMPHVSDAELDAAVRLQALDIIPFPVESSVLSARRIGRVEGAPTPTDRILLAAAHRDLVDPIVETVTEAGVVVLGVEFAPFALVRSLADPKMEGPEAIVSIGANLTTVVIHEGGEPQLVRTISGGGATITRAIAAALDIPFGDAEAMKFRLGLGGEATERIPAEARAAARDSSMALLGEIRSSIQYYATLHGRNECQNVVLTGGGALLAGLRERLQHQMQTPIVERGCLDHLDVRRLRLDLARDLRAVGAVVVGTALPVTPGSKAIDLLPPEVLARQRQRRVERSIAVAAAAAMLGLGGVGAHRFLEVRNAKQAIATTQESMQLLEGQIAKYDDVAVAHQTMLEDESIVRPIVNDEVNWPGVLQAIDQYTPAGMSASGFIGTATAPPTATSARVTSPVGGSGSPPSPSDVLGSIQLTLNGPAYPAFQAWFDAISASQRLTIVEFSGVSDAGKGITFSAQLAITGALHTDRLSEFEIPGSSSAA